MREKNIPRIEYEPSHEKTVTSARQEQVHKHKAEQAERARQEKSVENIAKIQELAHAEAKETQKITAEERSQNETDALIGTTQSLKATAYARTLAKTQHKLPKTARVFSKFVHSPAVDKASEISSHTVARPSGFLGGSICAFLGSLIVYYYGKHYGFKYNYLLLLFFFAAGYCVGLILELIVWAVYSRRQHY